MKQLPLTNSKLKFTLDDADYETYKTRTWYLTGDGYASCTTRNIKFHRLILDEPKGIVDHINVNKLDNRRSNLRITDIAGNNINRPKQKLKNATSKYKGVSRSKNKRDWRARIVVKGKEITLGEFSSEKAAAKVYDLAAVRYFKEFACLNFKESA